MSTSETDWKKLFTIGGITAWVFVIYSFITMAQLILFGGQPENALEAFTMLAENKLIGFLRLDIPTLLIMPLYYVIFLCIFISLWKTDPALATLGSILAFAGVTLFLATPSAFSWIPLNEKYLAATSVAEKDQLIAAGEALLASDMWHGSGAIIGGLLILIASLILSIVMLKSGTFSKATAIVGIVTYALDLAHALVGFISPQAGVILMAIAGPLYLVWFPLLGRDLFRMSRD
jgi:hypothetical protein